MPMYYNTDKHVVRIADSLEEIAKQERLGNLLIANDGLFMAGAINDGTYISIVKRLVEEISGVKTSDDDMKPDGSEEDE